MNINDLNKTQIILLTLFVSFVTSIATGIVTVTLMDQAPRGVTQTINQVVERTVERVVPASLPKTTEVRSIVMPAEDSIVKTINAASPALARISATIDGNTKETGIGFLLEKQTMLITSSSAVIDNQAKYAAAFSNSLVANLSLSYYNATTGVAILKVESVEEKKSLIPNPFADDSKKPKPEIASLSFLKLATSDITPGKTVIALADVNTVAVGSVSGLTTDASSTNVMIKTGAASLDNVGGPVLNITGEVVGMSWTPGLAVSAGSLKAIIDSIQTVL